MSTDTRTRPALPDGYESRAPTPDDAARVVHVVGSCEAAELGEAQVDLEDILGDWRRPGVDIARDGIFVVDANGEPAGYGELAFGRAEGNVLPSHRGRGIGTFLADWIERRAREVGATFVRQIVPAGATDRLELLAAAGYEVSDSAWELGIDAGDVGERPPLPAGVEVRDFRPGIDDEATFRLIEDAFSHWPNREPNTLGGWRALTIERDGFEPWLLPLLWRGDELVGAAYCIDYPAMELGWIQQLAVREDQRGRGLGVQLLHETFERFAANGRTTFGLSTDSRTGALGLYQRVGMRVVREFTGHSLPLG
jgi:GNAT superfamily N-acetyltransferase